MASFIVLTYVVARGGEQRASSAQVIRQSGREQSDRVRARVLQRRGVRAADGVQRIPQIAGIAAANDPAHLRDERVDLRLDRAQAVLEARDPAVGVVGE